MADIELVIKISEDSYKATCNGCMLPPDVENVVQGIINGTLLSKGHGRLIDADEIQFENAEFDTYGDYSRAFDAIDYAPTIIEADKAESEGGTQHDD